MIARTSDTLQDFYLFSCFDYFFIPDYLMKSADIPPGHGQVLWTCEGKENWKIKKIKSVALKDGAGPSHSFLFTIQIGYRVIHLHLFLSSLKRHVFESSKRAPNSD